MRALANTTISVLRGTTTDEFGDETDNASVAASGIPCSLVEQVRQAFTPESPTPRVVRYTIGRVNADTDVREDDRVKDEYTGRVYIVQAVSQTGGLGMVNDLRLDLKYTT
ncbi:hypothetical protein [Streptomyces griseoaurantiacus]|uniref:Head-tail adaptor protein n=1 Tax=Streptomyces griseoaurantiacus TaxID=68213 RepID=A0A7W2DSK6_9ACTN|nr:hypothetical protein [Streptomyces griseoaurantiacus]MBA5222225.1 hypothetical protein [Streptomyces griseoaurantiacus]